MPFGLTIAVNTSEAPPMIVMYLLMSVSDMK